MPEGVSNVAKAAASTINWLPIVISILATIIVATIVATSGFLAFQHYNISDQNYDLNREMGEVHGKVDGLADSHKELKPRIKRLEEGQEDLKSGQKTLTTTVGNIETIVDGLQFGIERLSSNTCAVPPCEIPAALVLTIDELVESTPNWFVFAVELPIESSPLKVEESSFMVNESVYSASWVRMVRDPEEMNMVPWTIRLGPIKTDVDRKQVFTDLNNEGIPVARADF